MRLRCVPTPEQRAALEAQLLRLQQPGAALELPCERTDLVRVTTTVASVHTDRFVLRARLSFRSGEERSYALKAYADDFAGRAWTHARALAERYRTDAGELCLPIACIASERLLVFPWVEGAALAGIVDDSKPRLLRRAARMIAELHRLDWAPEPPTSAERLVEQILARCNEPAELIAPLRAQLVEAVRHLDPTDPAPVHGDLGAGQFLLAGERLVLLDFDMLGYADPAYDAGHFLAQLERRVVVDGTPSVQGDRWLGAFQDAYLAAQPRVSLRNMAFYRALTLVRKMSTLRRRGVSGGGVFHELARRASAALEQMAAPAVAP